MDAGATTLCARADSFLCLLAVYAPLLTAAVSAVATIVIALFSMLVWRLHKRMNWLTGALESHSDIQLALKAQELQIEVVNWDPTVERVPSARKHGEPREITRIYSFMPPAQRAGDRAIRQHWGRIGIGTLTAVVVVSLALSILALLQ